MQTLNPYFGVYWGAREQTFGAFIEHTREFLVVLRDLHPDLGTLYALGDRPDEEAPLGTDLEHLDAVALERGWNRKTPKKWFSNLDDSGRPTGESLVDVGWRLSLVNEPEAEKTDAYVHLSISSGQTTRRVSRNSVVLSVRDPESPLLAPAFAAQLFRHMIDHWHADRAWVTDDEYRDAVWDDDTLEQLGWLNFRFDPGFAAFLPATVHREPYAGGILFTIGDGRVLDRTDTAEIELGRSIQAAVKAASA